jgi:hypothetical protein
VSPLPRDTNNCDDNSQGVVITDSEGHLTLDILCSPTGDSEVVVLWKTLGREPKDFLPTQRFSLQVIPDHRRGLSVEPLVLGPNSKSLNYTFSEGSDHFSRSSGDPRFDALVDNFARRTVDEEMLRCRTEQQRQAHGAASVPSAVDGSQAEPTPFQSAYTPGQDPLAAMKGFLYGD